MEFTSQDIKQLYGTHFFIIPQEQKEEIALEQNEETSLPETNLEASTADEAHSENSVDKIQSEQKQPQTESIQPSPSPYHAYFMEGAAVSWKMKPQTQLVLILQQKEFSDRDLTRGLRHYILEAGIPTEMIGFGIIPDGAKSLNCADMKPKVGVIFQLFGQKLPSPVEIEGKSLFAVADLALINSKPAFQKRLLQILQQAYQLTQS